MKKLQRDKQFQEQVKQAQAQGGRALSEPAQLEDARASVARELAKSDLKSLDLHNLLSGVQFIDRAPDVLAMFLRLTMNLLGQVDFEWTLTTKGKLIRYFSAFFNKVVRVARGQAGCCPGQFFELASALLRELAHSLSGGKFSKIKINAARQLLSSLMRQAVMLQLFFGRDFAHELSQACLSSWQVIDAHAFPASEEFAVLAGLNLQLNFLLQNVQTQSQKAKVVSAALKTSALLKQLKLVEQLPFVSYIIMLYDKTQQGEKSSEDVAAVMGSLEERCKYDLLAVLLNKVGIVLAFLHGSSHPLFEQAVEPFLSKGGRLQTWVTQYCNQLDKASAKPRQYAVYNLTRDSAKPVLALAQNLASLLTPHLNESQIFIQMVEGRGKILSRSEDSSLVGIVIRDFDSYFKRNPTLTSKELTAVTSFFQGLSPALSQSLLVGYLKLFVKQLRAKAIKAGALQFRATEGEMLLVEKALGIDSKSKEFFLLQHELCLLAFGHSSPPPECRGLLRLVGTCFEYHTFKASQLLALVEVKKDIKNMLIENDKLRVKLVAHRLLDFYRQHRAEVGGLKGAVLLLPTILMAELDRSDSLLRKSCLVLDELADQSTRDKHRRYQLVSEAILLLEAVCSINPSVVSFAKKLIEYLLQSQFTVIFQRRLQRSWVQLLSLLFVQIQKSTREKQLEVRTLDFRLFLPYDEASLGKRLLSLLSLFSRYVVRGALLDQRLLVRQIKQADPHNSVGMALANFVVENVRVQEGDKVLGRFRAAWMSEGRALMARLKEASPSRLSYNSLVHFLLKGGPDLEHWHNAKAKIMTTVLQYQAPTLLRRTAEQGSRLSQTVWQKGLALRLCKLVQQREEAREWCRGSPALAQDYRQRLAGGSQSELQDLQKQLQGQIIQEIAGLFSGGSPGLLALAEVMEYVLVSSDSTALSFVFNDVFRQMPGDCEGLQHFLARAGELQQCLVRQVNSHSKDQFETSQSSIFRRRQSFVDEVTKAEIKAGRRGLGSLYDWVALHRLGAQFFDRNLQTFLIEGVGYEALFLFLSRSLGVDKRLCQSYPTETILLLARGVLQLCSLENAHPDPQGCLLDVLELALCHFDKHHDFFSIRSVKEGYSSLQLSAKRELLLDLFQKLDQPHLVKVARLKIPGSKHDAKVLLGMGFVLRHFLHRQLQVICAIQREQQAPPALSKISKDTLCAIVRYLGPSGQSLSLAVLSQLRESVGDGETGLKQVAQAIGAQITKEGEEGWSHYRNNPHFLVFFVQFHEGKRQFFHQVSSWSPPDIQLLLAYLEDRYYLNPVQNYAIGCLLRFESSQLLFYLPQLLQCLTRKCAKSVQAFLLRACQISALFQHQLLWAAKVQLFDEPSKFTKNRTPEHSRNLELLREKCLHLISKAKRRMNQERTTFFNHVDLFFEEVTSISGKLRPAMPAQQKKAIIAQELRAIRVPRDLYLPTNPRFKVVAINCDSGTPMQSAAKCPIRVSFLCSEYAGPDHYFQNRTRLPFMMELEEEEGERDSTVEIACIFKVFDDIRQDCLALQVAALLDEVFRENNVQARLFPYRTISNRTGQNFDLGGIIECIPNSASRDEIGKTSNCDLLQYFVSRFGHQHSKPFLRAQRNFARSLAGYSLFCYLMQVKDRHNGNILIDARGNLVHIDFGFIFQISPGGNMRFQSADFKLTEEMLLVLGGTQAESWRYFEDLLVRAFLVARRYSEHFVQLIAPMTRSSLGCFLPDSLDKLRDRFCVGAGETEASSRMRSVLHDSADKWTTNWYDRIQWMQNKIHH